jgi:hypothetical protein
MKVYKKDKNGFIEQIETDGNYLPKGWSRTYEAAAKKN